MVPMILETFFDFQCRVCGIQVPTLMRKWLNLKYKFGAYYKVDVGNLSDMLAQLGFTFEGQQHSGLDDAKNIARITSQLIQDGMRTKANDGIAKYKPHKFRLREIPLSSYLHPELQKD